ncbi:hypothetical protein [Demequina aurantiaca]|uniref:hypothetical protein n=1 Tax=Demequina aurantiaca TaxID=676200 RepID=UPI003D3428C0
MSTPPPVPPSGNNSSDALKKARQPADAATTFGIIAMAFGLISISTSALGAIAIAMGVLGLVFARRGNSNDSDEPRGKSWRQTAAAFSVIGIVMGTVGLL